MDDQDRMEAFPLHWPPGRDRTPPNRLQEARFGSGKNSWGDHPAYGSRRRLTIADGRDRLLHELRLFGAREIVISSNLRVRQDGLPLSRQSEPSDQGVAVYFRLRDQPHCMSCDRWTRIADNLAAIAKSIAAMRGQLRWGAADSAQLFAGFRALPAMDAKKTWRQILNLPGDAKLHDVKARFARLMLLHHPDRGGHQAMAAEISAAYSEALREFGKE